MHLTDGKGAIVFESFVGKAGCTSFFTILLPEVGRRLDWAVNGVERQESEERFFGIRFANEVVGFRGEADRKSFAIRAVFEFWIIEGSKIATAW